MIQQRHKFQMLAPNLKPTAPIYIVKLRPEPQCVDPVKALRRALKFLVRNYQLRCVSIEKAQQ